MIVGTSRPDLRDRDVRRVDAAERARILHTEDGVAVTFRPETDYVLVWRGERWLLLNWRPAVGADGKQEVRSAVTVLSRRLSRRRSTAIRLGPVSRAPSHKTPGTDALWGRLPGSYGSRQ